MAKTTVLSGLLATALLVAAAAPAAAGPDRVELVGETALPHAMQFDGTTVGGLSGLDHDPRTGQWVLISDDRSDKQPARIYTGRFEGGGFRLTGTAPLLRPDGTTYPKGSVDPEDVRWDPRTGGIWWTSEGERAQQLIDPAIRRASADGTFTGDLPIADNLRMRPETGPKQNEVLEGLTLANGGSLVVSAMEGPLIEDGESPTAEHGALSRITVQTRSGHVLGQYAYPLDPVFAESPTGGFANNGVTAILADRGGRYLVLERSFVTGVGNSVRLYQVDLRGATNVRDVDSLVGAQVRPVRKELVADLADLGLSTVDNVEGMSWGPRLPDGRRSLVLVSDDNFSPAQTTQLITLALR
ncbi:esterase-like activity of phytase family protein [Saccharopolyspora hirsuta]|uniref:Esterase-like activity of phytase family protein n=1 Tax=Saccharopolyspora hirsuta TaxID=1837 RepID=A0A5M7C399_SACHI|nr:esterase-like activity of phytase family protein [Saccharopolyspora hirsuta]KAA5836243.1 esterase-like activity of phytase family protein [Saccharopolyspora hirsuta]